MQKKIRGFFSSENILISFVLLLSSVLRLYRINDLLGFWYDQGRDALVIWDFIHNHKFFLIGPMMADTGIFRGPWYYYLITPFYWLGGGNPIWPSVFLILTSVLAIYFVYKIGGLAPAFLVSISVYVISASRWLSDPTPTLLISVILIWTMYKFLEKKTWSIPLAAFLVGMALNFSAATEIFYILAILVIIFFKRKNIPSFNTLLLSAILFLVAFLPQIFFEIRHPGVQTLAFYQFLFKENSFTLSFWKILITRPQFYYNLIASKFWINGGLMFAPFFIFFVFNLIKNWETFWKDDKFKILFIFSLAPIVGTLFFTGTKGNVYEYYFTGYYLIWTLLFTKVVSNKFILSIFIITSICMNFIGFRDQYFINIDNPGLLSYKSQLAAVDWIYDDAKGSDFNVDVYVPPVIPYAYQYLFVWYGKSKFGRMPIEKNIQLLYTLSESDSDHPDRISAWFKRQDVIGKVQKSEIFGSITVQKRQRYENNNN